MERLRLATTDTKTGGEPMGTEKSGLRGVVEGGR